MYRRVGTEISLDTNGVILDSEYVAFLVVSNFVSVPQSSEFLAVHVQRIAQETISHPFINDFIHEAARNP
jgi:hypothetical protein